MGRSGELLEFALIESGLSDVPLAFLNVVFRMPLNHESKDFGGPRQKRLIFIGPWSMRLLLFLHHNMFCFVVIRRVSLC